MPIISPLLSLLQFLPDRFPRGLCWPRRTTYNSAPQATTQSTTCIQPVSFSLHTPGSPTSHHRKMPTGRAICNPICPHPHLLLPDEVAYHLLGPHQLLHALLVALDLVPEAQHKQVSRKVSSRPAEHGAGQAGGAPGVSCVEHAFAVLPRQSL